MFWSSLNESCVKRVCLQLNPFIMQIIVGWLEKKQGSNGRSDVFKVKTACDCFSFSLSFFVPFFSSARLFVCFLACLFVSWLVCFFVCF